MSGSPDTTASPTSRGPISAAWISDRNWTTVEGCWGTEVSCRPPGFKTTGLRPSSEACGSLKTSSGLPLRNLSPNVPALEDAEGGGVDAILSLREQMTRHRGMEPCATCHRIMDGMGFALENFSADAKWRNEDGESSHRYGRRNI